MNKTATMLARLLAAASLFCLAAANAAIAPNAPAPDFTLKTLQGPNIRLAEQRGRVVLVNFWATWCGPCKQEMPHLNRLYDKYRSSGFVLMGVNVDEDPKVAAGTAGRFGLRFPVLFDADKAVSKLYDLQSMPATVLIDRDGKVRFLHRGYREGLEEAYDRQIRELVKE
jgi:peroxiredoxin